MEGDMRSSDDPQGKQFATEFWEKLTEAARRDGRLLDPLWRDLSEEEEHVDEDAENAAPKQSAYHTTKLALTSSPEEDLRLYESFRFDFSVFPIKNIPHKTYLEGDSWDSLIQEHEHSIDHPHARTLLRSEALDMFSATETSISEELLVVPRIQFLFIELTRIKEEVYDRNFRQKLELFDIKTQSDLLESSLSDPSRQDVALKTLKLLRTQWPNPSISVLKKTGVVKLLRRGAKSGRSEKIRSECQHIFSSWKDLSDLGQITKAWPIDDEVLQKLRPILQKAGESLVKDLAMENGETSSSSFPKVSHGSQQQNGEKNNDLVSTEELTFEDISEPDSVATTFDKHGMVVLTGYLSSVEEYVQQAKDAFQVLMVEQLEPRGLKPDGTDNFVIAQAQLLPGYRIDNRYGILDVPESPIARLGQRLCQEIPGLLFPNEENNFRIIKAGILHSLPQKNDAGNVPQAQSWHRDGEPLFTNSHHPAHCFNIYVPLVDTSVENGAIEVVPGTHVNKRYYDVVKDITRLAQRDSSEHDKLSVRVQSRPGTIVAFDTRLLFRGLVNRSLVDQPMLYFTFAKNWFREEDGLLQDRQDKTLQDPAVHTMLIILSRMRHLVTGTPSSRLVALDETYGHPHYTSRFDLLLLDSLLSEDPMLQSTAMVNMAAVVHFSTLSEGDKETTAREFLYAFSQRNHDRKIRVMESARRNRQERCPHEGVSDSAKGDVNTLYDLAALILLEESTLLKKLGFSSDEHGVCCLLAMLKAHAARDELGCIGITQSQLDEAFTSWWHTAQGRFTFVLGDAESTGDHANQKILVLFSGLGTGRIVGPEWGEILQNVLSDARLDVLHVIDPAFSFYCQDPEGLWKGCDYYISELQLRLSDYQNVMFLGAGAGATAALRFSTMADKVHVLSPTIDIMSCKTILRSDFPEAVKEAFQQSLLEVLKEDRTAITVHYRESCTRDVAQMGLLPKRDNINIVPCCDSEDRNLITHLNSNGALLELIETEIREFIEGSMARRQSVLVGSF